jgi:hypothetical protein
VKSSGLVLNAEDCEETEGIQMVSFHMRAWSGLRTNATAKGGVIIVQVSIFTRKKDWKAGDSVCRSGPKVPC